MTAQRDLQAAGITGAALLRSYNLCRQLNAEHGKTYFLATMLLPAAKRPYVHALYGFARHVDDIVDEMGPELDPAERAARFTSWSEDFLTDLEWGSTSDPVSRAVLDTIATWQIPHSYFVDFLDAMRMDLTVTTYESYNDLATYMWGSAAVIGLQMLPILGRASETIRWDRLEPYATDLGMAFQLTNFIRDVAEDLRRGRIYLPQESLRQFEVDADRLSRGRVDESVRNLLAWEIERARGLYHHARAGVEMVEPTSRDCLRTAITLYSEILDEIEGADYDVFSGRTFVGRARRAQVGISGLREAIRARRRAGSAAVIGVPTRPRATASLAPSQSRIANLRPARKRSAGR